MLDLKSIAEKVAAKVSDNGIDLWGEDNEIRKEFNISFSDATKAIQAALTAKTIKDTLECEFVDTEGLIGLTANTTFHEFREYCIENYNFPREATMNLGVCDFVFECTLERIEEEYDLDISLMGHNPNDTILSDDVIDGLCDRIGDEFNYSFIETEDFIDELIRFISEAKDSDKQLMKDDLKYLYSLDDEYIFSSRSTNEYIAFSDNPSSYNNIAANLFAKSISILPELQDDMMFFALQASNESNREISYCAAGKVENKKFSGIIYGYEGGGDYSDWYVKDHKFLPQTFSDNELIENDTGAQLLDISMDSGTFTDDCYKVLNELAPWVETQNRHMIKVELASEFKDGEIRINASDFHPIDYGTIEFGGESTKWHNSLKEFTDEHIDFKELIKKEFESVLVTDTDGEIDSQEAIALAVANLEGNLAFSESINIKETRDYITAIVKDIEDRAGDGESNICNMNIKECEICIDCGTVMLPDDECYSRHDGEAMCSKCSHLCDSCDKYHSEDEMTFTDDGNICTECTQTVKYPKKLVVHVIDKGSDIIIETLEKAGYKVDLTENVLAYSTDTFVVCKSIEKINAAISLLDKSVVDGFRKVYLKHKELHDTEDLMQNITLTVMKSLDDDAEAYFYSLSDYIQSKLIDIVSTTKPNQESFKYSNLESFLTGMSLAATRVQKWQFLYETEYENDSIELNEAMSAMTDAEVSEWFPKICAEHLGKKLNLL